jgi:serine/threonine protein kinase
MASKGIMHRDLKPSNIMIDENLNVTIIDFGLALHVEKDKEYLYSQCGTPGYIAPEILRYDHNIPSTHYNEKCDVFSLGCIFYQLILGYPLFPGKSRSVVMELNKSYNASYVNIQEIQKELDNPNSKHPKTALELMMSMLKKDRRLRSDAVSASQHPYLTSGIVLDAYNKPYSENDMVPILNTTTVIKITRPVSKQYGSHNASTNNNDYQNSLTGCKKFSASKSLDSQVDNISLHSMKTDSIESKLTSCSTSKNSVISFSSNNTPQSNSPIGEDSTVTSFSLLSRRKSPIRDAIKEETKSPSTPRLPRK